MGYGARLAAFETFAQERGRALRVLLVGLVDERVVPQPCRRVHGSLSKRPPAQIKRRGTGGSAAARRSLSRASFSICRTRSALTPRVEPISFSVREGRSSP